MMDAAFATPARPLLKRAQDFTLWLIAAAHVVALASLLLVIGSLSPARAEAPACGGNNLLDQLKVEKPDVYQQVLADAAKVPNGKGIFWKVEKGGIAPSYLLGTMHVSDPRVLKMPAGAAEARSRAKTIIIESDEVIDDRKAMAALLSKPELMMLTDGSSIDTLMPKDDVALLETGLKARGVPLSAVSRMRPWMLMALVSVPPCEIARKSQNVAFLDKKIAQEAMAEGKQVNGLETLEEQAAAMNSIPIAIHLKSLMEAIKMGSRINDVFETMTQVYLSGDIGLTMPMLKAVAPGDSDDEAGYGKFDKLIVTERNHRMAERAAPILAEGAAFMAVGALHLPGDEGLIELFRKQGFKVTAVD